MYTLKIGEAEFELHESKYPDFKVFSEKPYPYANRYTVEKHGEQTVYIYQCMKFNGKYYSYEPKKQ